MGTAPTMSTSPLQLPIQTGVHAMSTVLFDYLKSQGFSLYQDPEYQSLYKIDMVITKVMGVHQGVNLGVQIVDLEKARLNAAGTQDKFVSVVNSRIVQRGIYIEVDRRALGTGAKRVIMSSILNFMFNKKHSDRFSIGVRVMADNSYHYFNLIENLRRMRKQIHDRDHEDDRPMAGKVTFFNTERGYGFIDGPDGKFFFHITDVVEDDTLSDILTRWTPDANIEVSFLYGGSSGKKCPKAIEVGCDEYDDEEDITYLVEDVEDATPI